jgi:hypothetical protein
MGYRRSMSCAAMGYRQRLSKILVANDYRTIRQVNQVSRLE